MHKLLTYLSVTFDAGVGIRNTCLLWLPVTIAASAVPSLLLQVMANRDSSVYASDILVCCGKSALCSPGELRQEKASLPPARKATKIGSCAVACAHPGRFTAPVCGQSAAHGSKLLTAPLPNLLQDPL